MLGLSIPHFDPLRGYCLTLGVDYVEVNVDPMIDNDD